MPSVTAARVCLQLQLIKYANKHICKDMPTSTAAEIPLQSQLLSMPSITSADKPSFTTVRSCLDSQLLEYAFKYSCWDRPTITDARASLLFTATRICLQTQLLINAYKHSFLQMQLLGPVTNQSSTITIAWVCLQSQLQGHTLIHSG